MTRAFKVLVFALLLTGSALNQATVAVAEPMSAEPLVEAWKLIESAKLETSEARALDAYRRAEAVLKHFLMTHPDDEAAKRIAGGPPWAAFPSTTFAGRWRPGRKRGRRYAPKTLNF